MPLKFKDPPPPGQRPKNVLLYGPPKTKKTGGAASAPGPTYYLNLDLPNAILDAQDRHNQDGHIQWVDYEGFTTLVDLMLEVKRPDPPMATVVTDPVGDLYRLMLEEESGRAVRPTLPQYQAVGTHLERFCRALCESPVNAIFVAHDFPQKDEATGEMMRLPFTGSASNPSLGQKLMGMVDIIGYTGVIENDQGGFEYVSQLVAGKGRQGGNRFDFAAALGPIRATDLGEWFGVIDAAEAKQEAAQNNNEKKKEKVAA